MYIFAMYFDYFYGILIDSEYPGCLWILKEDLIFLLTSASNWAQWPRQSTVLSKKELWFPQMHKDESIANMHLG